MRFKTLLAAGAVAAVAGAALPAHRALATVTRPIAFLSDFGLDDTYVGQVKGVIAARAPESMVIDLSHAVEPYAIEQGAWPLVLIAVLANLTLLPALLLYFAWGLLQQFVFQFYLLGRLLYVMPAAAAIALTGIAFSMVHFPRVPVMAVTLIAGIVWALLYRRYRSLVPLAASHALLGATLHYWVFGRDLLELWLLRR